MSEIAIQVKHLDKMYKLYNKPSDRLRETLGLKVPVREHYALRDVNFQVERGETVGIIGTNGSGKSTILKIITGVLNPTAGEVTVNGRISALLELGAGFNTEYTGIENIYLNGTMMGFSREEVDARLQDILDFADIGDFVYQPVKAYSSGMFVRLAFAVAINIDPEILIVDEALSVGDVFFQAKCYRKFEEFKKMGRTILFVSHDLSSISRYCDRVILLNKGVKMEEGSPKQMVDMYKQLLVGQDPAKAEENKETQKENWSEQFQVNPNMLEYGSKLAEIVDFAVLDEKGLCTNTIEKGSSFQIKMKVVFHESIQEPIMAYTFKDIKGTEITGTNTLFEKMAVEHSEAGDTCTVTFRQDMFLQGGEYLLSFGCTGYKDGEFTVFHRLYDACNITVVSNKNTVGFYDMNSKVEIHYGEKA
ncbi:ABC transporter ATP-binding protein [Blautia sp.]|uniref:ABC transporter ATP-binding protein n=1 Tax=Blautia sp. TaxID=1955243 RepID=UPI00280B4218|nr:ABC transporter ATP-binding protein [Blautia sp.]MDY3015768.1 ABC transporter ATP-binding protein [Blautia sp.]